MKEVRCKKCNKLLGYVQGDYEIKCDRCKALNTQDELITNETKFQKRQEGFKDIKRMMETNRYDHTKFK